MPSTAVTLLTLLRGGGAVTLAAQLAAYSSTFLASWYSDNTGLNVGNGDPLDSWLDTIAAIQPSNTGTNRPTWHAAFAGFGGQPAVRFQRANNQRLRGAYPAGGFMMSGANRTLYQLVYHTTGGSTEMGSFGEGQAANVTSASWWLQYNRTNEGSIRTINRDDDGTTGGTTTAGAVLPINEAHVVAVQKIGTSHQVFVDGAAVGSPYTFDPTSSDGIDNVALGCVLNNNNPALFYDGYLGATIIDNAGDAEKTANVSQVIMDWAGIT